MYGLRTKLVCLSTKPLAYHKICQFPINYKSVMFYSAGPWSQVCQSNYLPGPEVPIALWGYIQNTSFSSKVRNDPNKLEYLSLASLSSTV
jgi:hypothetical protein